MLKSLRFLPILALAFVLTGCFSFGSDRSGTGSTVTTVTLTGTVSPGHTKTQVAGLRALAAQTDDGLTSNIPVRLFRVTPDGDLQAIPEVTEAFTDEAGRYRFTNVPDRTRVVVEAELKNGVTMRSTVVTDGYTSLDVEPFNHVVYEVAAEFTDVMLYFWELDLSPEQLKNFITELARLVKNEAVPVVGEPPAASEWTDVVECRNPDSTDATSAHLSALDCYRLHLGWELTHNEALRESTNELMEQYVPLVTLPRTDTPIPVDGSLSGWEDITPVVENRAGARPNTEYNVRSFGTAASAPGFDWFRDFRQLYVARDDQKVYWLFEYETPLKTSRTNLSLILLPRAGRYEESVYISASFTPGMSGEPQLLVDPVVVVKNEEEDPANLELEIGSRFIELSIPYEWVERISPNSPFWVMANAMTAVDTPSDPGSTSPWRDILPVVRLKH